MVARRHDAMTVEDFLALDREKLDRKYEFRNGQKVAMAGGSNNHTLMIGNIHAAIHNHLRTSPCAVFSEGTLKIEDECYMLDVMVTCDEQDLTENKTYIEHPKLVVEVMSPSNEKDDRVDKVWIYAQCLSIQEYILVNWDLMLVQKMTRKGTGVSDRYQWLDTWYHPGETVELETIGLTIPVEDIYAKVNLPPLDSLRGCTERGKIAERKKQEEETGKEEPPKEKQYEQIQYKSSDLSIRCNRPRMGDLGTLDTCCQARGTVTGD